MKRAFLVSVSVFGALNWFGFLDLVLTVTPLANAFLLRLGMAVAPLIPFSLAATIVTWAKASPTWDEAERARATRCVTIAAMPIGLSIAFGVAMLVGAFVG